MQLDQQTKAAWTVSSRQTQISTNQLQSAVLMPCQTMIFIVIGCYNLVSDMQYQIIKRSEITPVVQLLTWNLDKDCMISALAGQPQFSDAAHNSST